MAKTVKPNVKSLQVKDSAEYLSDVDLNVQKSKIKKKGEKKRFKLQVNQFDDGKGLYKALDKERNEISLSDFCKLDVDHKLKLVSNIKSWEDLKAETFIAFDFGMNRDLLRHVGLGDLMPSKIRKITLNGLEYTRRANQGFYSETGGYLAIFNGTKVRIPEIDENYNDSRLLDYSSRFGADVVDDEYLDDLNDLSLSFDVDVKLLKTLLDYARLNNSGVDAYAFLHKAARYVINAEMRYGRYKSVHGLKYTNSFLKDVLKRFNFADHKGFVDYVFAHYDPAVLVEFEEGEVKRDERRVKAKIKARARAERKAVVLKSEPVLARSVVFDSGERGAFVQKEINIPAYSRLLRFSPDPEMKDLIIGMERDEPLVYVTTFDPRFKKDRKMVLKKTVAIAFKRAQEIAKSQGYGLGIFSGYRSAKLQKSIDDKNPNKGTTAPPGRSWHQSGGAMDIVLYDLSTKKPLTPRSAKEANSGQFYQKHLDDLERIMNTVTAVRLSDTNVDEAWHFEIGSNDWYLAMKHQGVLPAGVSNSNRRRYTYLRDQLDLKSYHRYDKNYRASVGDYVVPVRREKHVEPLRGGAETAFAESKVNIPEEYMGTYFQKSLESFQFEGGLDIKRLDGNGGRPVAVITPPDFDASRPVKMLIHFHGTHSEGIGQKRLNKHDKNVCMSRFQQVLGQANKTDENIVILYPLSAGVRSKFDKIKYDKKWMKKNVGDDFDTLVESAAASVGVKVPDQVFASGHSAGGEALTNIAESGYKTKVSYIFLDASYGKKSNWGDRAIKVDPTARFHMYFQENDNKRSAYIHSKKYFSKWDRADNVTLVRDNVKHAFMIRDHLFDPISG